jgi:hypothetical protein
MRTTDNTAQLQELNRVTALLRRNGYSYNDRGTWVEVIDPVHTVQGRLAIPTSSRPVALHSVAQTRQFLSARS